MPSLARWELALIVLAVLIGIAYAVLDMPPVNVVTETGDTVPAYLSR